MNPWLGIAAILAGLGGLVGLVKLLQKKTRISAELARKTVHVGMGLACLLFPWMFADFWPVALLALLALVGLAAVRTIPWLQRRWGSVLGAVERPSFGEFYFPAAVALVFFLAAGNWLLYFVPVLTLTMADTMGALIGLHYGRARYRTDEGWKSAEGSVAFFITAFFACHVPLLLFGNTGRAETLLIGLITGFFVMLLEAIAWRGQDNFIIPVGTLLLLQLFLPLGVSELLLRFGIMAGLVALVIIGRKRMALTDSAALAAALSGYFVWAFGGWRWLAVPLLLFAVYLALPSIALLNRPARNLRAVTRVMAGAFLWLACAQVSGDPLFFAPYLFCLAAHTGNIVSARLRLVYPRWTLGKLGLLAFLIPGVLFSGLGAFAAASGLLPMMGITLVPLSVALSIALFIPAWPLVHLPEHGFRIWVSETCIAILASLPGWWILLAARHQ